MIRIRFHGRGGHGMKTASRIVGTAAFLAGKQVQDSPIYGAERRGAPVAAFVRIDDAPILERGPIDAPNLIVIADESLLEDAATVLAGQREAEAVFVNCESAAVCHGRIAASVRLATFDVTQRTREVLGQAAAVSAGVAAAAARISGVANESQLLHAIRDELGSLGVDAEIIVKNERIAREVFAALPEMELSHQPSPPTPTHMIDVPYDGPLRGAPSILAGGNASQRHTGDWRVERPLIDRDRCTRCGLCLLQCPDGAIALDADGYPVIDYDHCKGCMICRQVCPVQAIDLSKEVRAW